MFWNHSWNSAAVFFGRWKNLHRRTGNIAILWIASRGKVERASSEWMSERADVVEGRYCRGGGWQHLLMVARSILSQHRLSLVPVRRCTAKTIYSVVIKPTVRPFRQRHGKIVATQGSQKSRAFDTSAYPMTKTLTMILFTDLHDDIYAQFLQHVGQQGGRFPSEWLLLVRLVRQLPYVEPVALSILMVLLDQLFY
jgi:hypothetical protein